MKRPRLLSGSSRERDPRRPASIKELAEMAQVALAADREAADERSYTTS